MALEPEPRLIGASWWAISQLPLAEAVSLSYSTPIFFTIAAVLLLGEVVRGRRWATVALGFIGVLIIVRPVAATGVHPARRAGADQRRSGQASVLVTKKTTR